jgi:hypothetical protein
MLALLRRPRTRLPPASPTTSSRLGRWSMARSRSRQRPIPRSSASCAFVPRSWRSTARRRSTPRLPGSCGRPSEAASPALTARPLGHAEWRAPTVGVRHRRLRQPEGLPPRRRPSDCLTVRAPDKTRDSDAAPHPAPASPVEGRTGQCPPPRDDPPPSSSLPRQRARKTLSGLSDRKRSGLEGNLT